MNYKYQKNIYKVVPKYDIAKAFSIGQSTVWKTLKWFNERGDLSDCPGSDRPCSQRSKLMIKHI